LQIVQRQDEPPEKPKIVEVESLNKDLELMKMCVSPSTLGTERELTYLMQKKITKFLPTCKLLPLFQINCRSFGLDTHVSRRVSVCRFAHFRKKLRQVIWNGGSTQYQQMTLIDQVVQSTLCLKSLISLVIFLVLNNTLGFLDLWPELASMDTGLFYA
jgi:hypothetical protein